VLDLGLGGREGLAQLGQRVASDQRGEKQPVRLERPSHLHQRAGEVVDELQRERRHHEIEARVAKRQRFGLGHDLQAGTALCIRHGIDRDDRGHGLAGGQHVADGSGRRRKVDGQRKRPQHRRQPVGQIIRDPVDQEGRRT
jgi:hypothetical protein